MVAKKLVDEDKMRADHSVFIKEGFSNLRKATEKFHDHEKSSFHLESVNKITALNNTPISALRGGASCQSGSPRGLQVSTLFGPSELISLRPRSPG